MPATTVTRAEAEERSEEGDPEGTIEADGVNPSGTKLAENGKKARTKKRKPRFSGPQWIN